MAEFSIEHLTQAIAGTLNEHFNGIPVYSNPNQQDTEIPCFFITFMPSSIDEQIDGFFLQKIGVDIVYLDEYNIPDLYDRYSGIAQTMDEVMAWIPFGHRVLHTSKRKWKIDLSALHYQFEIKVRVSKGRNNPAMKQISGISEGIKNE